MEKPLNTITKDVSVGIYNSEYVARIYADKIIVVMPYVKWIGNTGSYAESKQAIRDQKTIAAVLADLDDDCVDSAWGKIGTYLQDDWLAQAGY